MRFTTRLIFGLLICLFSQSALADYVKIVDDPSEALRLRYALIQKARHKINVSYFIFAKDNTAMEFLALLREKARAGVEVKIIIDALFNDIPKDVATHLHQAGVIIKNFNKLQWYRPGKAIKYRMHDKMFIVDGEEVILGGRNIEDTYYARAEKNYDDRDVYLQGETATKADSYFEEFWQASHLTPMKLLTKNNAKTKLKIEKAELMLDDKVLNAISEKSNFNLKLWQDDMVFVDDVDVLFDAISSRKNGNLGTTAQLYALMAQAQHSVLIDSPYLILSKELEALFKELIARGVKVRILTNSLKATDGIMPQAGYLMQRRKISAMGIELYEYFGDDSFHAKSLLIDEKISLIGSFNLDPRSQNLNTETMAVIHNETVAMQLKESMEQKLDLSYQIDSFGNPMGHGRYLPGVDLKKRATTRLIQYILAPLIKGLL
jgi:cardiolipin synthase C